VSFEFSWYVTALFIKGISRCNVHGQIKRVYTEYWWENLNGRDRVEELSADRKIILN
jgi:hypothetical protein